MKFNLYVVIIVIHVNLISCSENTKQDIPDIPVFR